MQGTLSCKSNKKSSKNSATICLKPIIKNPKSLSSSTYSASPNILLCSPMKTKDALITATPFSTKYS